MSMIYHFFALALLPVLLYDGVDIVATFSNSGTQMVLDAGRIVEFDAPTVLLKKGGTFTAMVGGSGDKQALYAMENATLDL